MLNENLAKLDKKIEKTVKKTLYKGICELTKAPKIFYNTITKA